MAEQLQEELKVINNEIQKFETVKSELTISEKEKRALMQKILKETSNNNHISNDMVNEFYNYLNSSDEFTKSLDEYYQEYKKIMDEQTKEINELIKSFDLDEIRAKISVYKEKYLELGNESKARECENLLNEIVNSVTLENVKEAISKIKNPSKVRELYKKNYISESEKYMKKLKSNKTYMFLKPVLYLKQITTLLGSEDDAQLFLYHFYKHFQSESVMNKNAVFLNEFTKNLVRCENEVYINRQTMIDSMKEIVTILRNI